MPPAGTRYEPRLSRGEWLHPSAGHHSYPPRRPRFPGPRKRCPRCELVSETTDRLCPVCGGSFSAGWRARLRRALSR